MKVVYFRRWRLEVDSQATSQAYEAIKRGSSEICNCATCRNFVAARQLLYPAEVMALFDQIGVNQEHEIELYHLARLSSGLHLYGGWFHAIGKIIGGVDAEQKIGPTSFRWDLERMTENLAMGFSASSSLVPSAFGGQPVIQLQFEAEVPWLIDGPEPD